MYINFMEEQFKDIPGYDGLYQVSNLGNVKSLERVVLRKNGRKIPIRESILKPNSRKDGYLSVNLYNKNRKRKNFRVQQLVVMAFLYHIPNGTYNIVIDHINNIKNDNKLENLQLITNRENSSKDKKGGTSKYTGVCWHKNRNKWYSSIRINGKSKYLGMFNNEYDAHLAYQNELNKIKG